MVPQASARPAGQATAGSESKGTRALCLLRHHRQQRKPVGSPSVRGQGLASLVIPRQPRAWDDVGSLQPAAGEISLASSSGDPFDLPSASVNPWDEEPYALMHA